MPFANGLYYELHGPSGAPPLILSSGLGGSASYWARNLDTFAATFHVLVYDHRGTGRSDRALPDIVRVDDLADDMIALMDGLRWRWASIVGHAAGGVAALAVARKVPDRVRKLVVVNGWAKADPHFLRCFEARLALLRHAGIDAYLRAQPIFLYPAEWISRHDAELAAELQQQQHMFPDIDTMEKRIAALAAFDATGWIDAIACPTLALSSQDDMLVPWMCSAALAAANPAIRHTRLAWGGHACNVTDPQRFEQAVFDFFRS